MIIKEEICLRDFEAWSGAINTLDRIVAKGKDEELEAILEEMYPEGMTDTELNDLLWFEDELVYEWLEIRSESVIKEEIKEVEDRIQELKEEYEEEIEGLDKEEENELWEEYRGEFEELEERLEELEEELKDF